MTLNHCGDSDVRGLSSVKATGGGREGRDNTKHKGGVCVGVQIATQVGGKSRGGVPEHRAVVDYASTGPSVGSQSSSPTSAKPVNSPPALTVRAVALADPEERRELVGEHLYREVQSCGKVPLDIVGKVRRLQLVPHRAPSLHSCRRHCARVDPRSWLSRVWLRR